MPDIEVLSFLEIARLSLNTEKLPDPIRNALNTIFTKKDGANLYRPKIVNEKITGIRQNKHPLIIGKRNAVRNILCIWYLLNGHTGVTKSFLQEYVKTGMTQKWIDELLELANQQYLEFFCLGVVRENIQKIIEQLNSDEFDLFTDKLFSPFSVNKNDPFDITPMLVMYSQEIPWEEYLNRYKKAEIHFNDKQYKQAKEELIELEKLAVIRLPVVEALNKNIQAMEAETAEAWEYFQKILK